ncbi:MAG: Acg family FMN-binding oxidoreductase [Kofleriaceae bacterium]
MQTGTARAQEVLTNAVAAAVMAPSAHNSQPWHFRIIGSRLDVFVDGDRHLQVIDAEGRQQLQSVGCALFNARVAVRAMGFSDVVTTVFRDRDEPGLVASLCLGPPHITTSTDHLLMQALPLRHTNRRAFLPRPVASHDSEVMAGAAAIEGAVFVRLHPEHKKQLAKIVEKADELQLGDPAFRDELSKWLIPFGSRRKDGIPFVEKEYGSNMPFTMMHTLRSPGLGAKFGTMEEMLVGGSPMVAVIGTRTDDRDAWIACGQALEAVLLHGTARGLSAAFMNQALELPEMRARVAELVPEMQFPQMVLRMGVPAEPLHHPAPRRDLSDVLEICS